jgi:arginyl-tRNA synthetase|eukprot:CAMPEP_0203017168 /NCGR_PEP_ID=MMETSP1401-20130829/21347_1 /ASSEMBLY_ACC=CAM_ASM_000894 /TAXON_ID=38833 /ORGANISM="Micromonas pusilla, Strain CCAC1681" /LENGTH=558 /DNA_ID=CAMNT_0049758889 /DNA_START=384 /DNA_END=2060 /DNA_ORIENTATION=-
MNVTECSNPSLGDYQCNSAMQIFAELKKNGDATFSNPRALAEAIVEAVNNKNGLFASTSVAGPGFINVTFSTSHLAQQLAHTVHDAEDGKVTILARKDTLPARKAVVDFSSPNIAKEMHVGHLRSTIIGETICRTLESIGVETVRLNHVGDWGTQFGMLLTHLSDKTDTDFEIRDLQAFYKESKLRFDSDEEFKLRSQAAVVKLQAGDEEMTAKWKQICEVSRQEFEEIYRLLDIKIEERGESFYNSMIPDVLDELIQKNIAVTNDGALCIFQEKDSPPLICRKSDGGFNYASTDLAAMRHRIKDVRADWIIYVTDMGQSRHFEAIFDAAKRADWLNEGQETSVRLDHVSFGLVMGEDGKRFRTRSGDTVPLKSLLSEAQSRCLESLQSRENNNMDKDKLEEAARIMGISAVKYADLHNNRTTNYTFSYDRMLDLKGNTAVYLLYTHARISSILDRAGDDDFSSFDEDELVLTDEKERRLALTILKLPDTIDSVIQDLLPSRLCDYTYSLCVAFNEFYGACKVIGDEREKPRLILCHATALSLRRAFYILGIEPLYRL